MDSFDLSVKTNRGILVRLQKFLAKAGIASRRKSEQLILSGKVKVNNVVTTTLGSKVDPEVDIVHYNNKEVKQEENKVYYMLNKPEGYITSVKDEKGRETVIDLMPQLKERIYPIGRLDYDTSGLLLLTNDGDLTYAITHPKYEVKKTYLATVKGTPGKNQLEQFRQGLMIEGRKTAKAQIEIIKQDQASSTLSITIIEGRNRQVRKMCAAIGHPVTNLQRIAIGEIELGTLSLGECRQLSKKEIKSLRNYCT